MYPYLLTDNTLTVIADGVTHTATDDNPKWSAMLDAFVANEWDTLIALLTPAVAITNYTSLTIKGGVIYDKKGMPIDNAIVPHILSLYSKGFPVEPLLNFLDKILLNPSMRSRSQIWRFVSTNKIVITPSGNLIFYKRVGSNYFDIHTGHTYCYTPGATISMDRYSVDDDPTSTCSTGLHVCSYEYLKSFSGERTVLCEVDPADIVSVPVDYENTKLRVCRLTVLEEVDQPSDLDTQVWATTPKAADSDDF